MRLRLLGSLLALVALMAAPAGAQQPVKIRAGWITTPASLIPLIFAKPGLARHNGKSYVFEPVYSRPRRCRSPRSPATRSTSRRWAIRAFRSPCRMPG